MSIRIGINGYGRIGRNIVRAIFEAGRQNEFEIVAINDLGSIKTHAHLTQFDTAHGRFATPVQIDGEDLLVGDQRIRMLSHTVPAQLPWGELGVDLVLECTGRFASRDKAAAHLQAGAKRVLVSQPAGSDVKTVVYGINHQELAATDDIVSNASCTTNCIAPLVQPLVAEVGLESGLMTTVHAYTNDQVLTDSYHTDLRRARSATLNMIPTKTGAAAAVGLVLPELAGKLDGYAVRVPTINVSMVDLSFVSSRETSVEEIHGLLRGAADGPLKGILAFNSEPLVSIDFNHHPASSIFDATLTKVHGRLVKVCAWYDNEWGFSNRMLDTAAAMVAAR